MARHGLPIKSSYDRCLPHSIPSNHHGGAIYMIVADVARIFLSPPRLRQSGDALSFSQQLADWGRSARERRAPSPRIPRPSRWPRPARRRPPE
ncbi:hypothetical protein FRACA_880015 [Frankia canadensis]|uniref:Uncharacterized protein n=1 Tax=Frankia canadensis TaxID=1836972 RepID=A0A2I2L219_9ACTN|nr:hypothetical protein FRACA_880015 [Frankia canadensis]SOU59254.1 hypothetical protein FRACA_880015 [Frankia canadensis]